MDRKILVIGGAGYIGSHMVQMLMAEGEDVVVLDNLSTGHRDAVQGCEFVQGDFGDELLLDRVFSAHRFDTVMHFASFIQVGESVKYPGRYYKNNVANTINLLNAMVQHQVHSLVFSSTAAVFGNPTYVPINEAHPISPINPYGRSKWMIEQILQDYEAAYGIHYVALRYFNAAGAEPGGLLGERHHPETHIVPLALRAAMAKLPCFTLYGNDYPTADGTCIRDYVHVSDLCAAHLLAVQYMREGKGSDVFNLGNGSGYSVREVLDVVMSVTNCRFDIQVSGRRSGDPAVLVADSTKARQILKWSPIYTELTKIVSNAYNFEKSLVR